MLRTRRKASQHYAPCPSGGGRLLRSGNLLDLVSDFSYIARYVTHQRVRS